MLQLVEHFGDQNDPGTRCGLCDVCAPEACVALAHRAPSRSETDAARRVLAALAVRAGQTVGQLHRDLFPGGAFDRRSLEHLLAALARAGDLRLEDDSFLKDGAAVHFKRVYPVGTERAPDWDGSTFTIAGEVARSSRRTRGAKRRARKDRGERKRPRASATRSAAGSPSAPKAAAGRAAPGPAAGASSALFEALRAWRLAEAKRAGVPAFRVMNDRTLLGVATQTPVDETALLRVAGVGPGLSRRYGAALLRIVARFAGR